MNATPRGAEVSGLLNILGSLTEEKDVLARSISFRVSVFTKIERQENRSPGPGPLALLLPIDGIKLGQVVHGFPREGLDHVKSQSFWIIEKRKIHEKRILKWGEKVNPWTYAVIIPHSAEETHPDRAGVSEKIL